MSFVRQNGLQLLSQLPESCICLEIRVLFPSGGSRCPGFSRHRLAYHRGLHPIINIVAVMIVRFVLQDECHLHSQKSDVYPYPYQAQRLLIIIAVSRDKIRRCELI